MGVEKKPGGSGDQQHHRSSDGGPAAAACDRGSLDALRGDVEGPGQEHGDRESDHEANHGQCRYPLRQEQLIHYRDGDLGHAPGHGAIDGGGLDYLAPFKLFEK